MKLFAKTIWIACMHAAMIFTVYGTKLFGLNVPYYFITPLWLGVPAVLAFTAYFLSLQKTKWLVSALYREGMWVFLASLSTLMSTYFGVFLALNTFGE
jgi:hypothetical protein